jgi:hypothetical protein
MIIEIAGVKIQYTSIPGLQEEIKAELARLETRLKIVAEEHGRLRRSYRGLRKVLEGKKSRPKQPATPAPQFSSM